jgi:hypothetical protein
MIAPTAGLKTEEELINYFDAVFAQIGDVPVVLQDFPFSTGVWMSPPTIARLIERFPQIQAIKEEDIPSAAKITRIRAALSRKVPILTGNNGAGIDGRREVRLAERRRPGADGRLQSGTMVGAQSDYAFNREYMYRRVHDTPPGKG